MWVKATSGGARWLNKIPRNSAKQAEFCYKLDTNKVETGDLVFFATGKDPKKVSHVGIVVDDNRFVHASSSKGVVVSQLTQPYYQQRLLMFGQCRYRSVEEIG